MFFNSIEFALFLPVVFLIYWFVLNKNLKVQNTFLLIASYFFYGWWDWRFLFLVIFSSLTDYFVGVLLSRESRDFHRKVLLLISIVINLGLLGFFKYFNFFVESFADAFSLFGRSFNVVQLRIVLPVGISFYTFQTLSYSIDVYQRKMKPTKDILAFFAFVSFFPQLVAGPIERASNLLPQFFKKREFEYNEAVDGMRQILWGLFKKIVIADKCAEYVNTVFSNYTEYSGSTLLFAAIFFAFQIYGDFSGYSDIAIGSARLFGFNLMRNFALPYFSRDVAEFWRRWHISLTTWFRDYVYIPLGGSRVKYWKQVRNIFVVFLISGFWHGANWTFVAWGFLNACFFLPLLILKQNRTHTDMVAEGRLLPTLSEALQMGATFFLTVIAWVFFRSATIGHAIRYLQKMFSSSLLCFPENHPNKIVLLVCFFLVVEWLQREKQHALQFDSSKIPRPVRWCLYYGIFSVIIFLANNKQAFIYFQF